MNDALDEMRRLYKQMINHSQFVDYPPTARNEDVKDLPVPFHLYDAHFAYNEEPQLKRIEVIRYGIQSDRSWRSVPTIDFMLDGQKETSLVSMYYLTEEDAQKVIDIEQGNIKFAKAKAELITIFLDNLPQLFDSIQCDE